MKLNKFFAMFFALSFVLSISTFAQEEMTMEQWQAEMNRLKARKESLQKESTALQTDVNNLKTNLANIQSYDDCMDDLHKLVNSSKGDVDNFRKAVSELEGKIRRKEGPKADREKDLAALQMNKVGALPEFYDKLFNQLPKMLADWVEAPTEISYSVVKGDHLWGIARKKEHYGNGFAWNKIYNANRDQIKNPDLIFPKQNFKIPNLTEEEKAKYDRIKKNYKPAPVQ
jgi:nucleoid-associated protein YgaU